jgi:hypothetical protein
MVEDERPEKWQYDIPGDDDDSESSIESDDTTSTLDERPAEYQYKIPGAEKVRDEIEELLEVESVEDEPVPERDLTADLQEILEDESDEMKSIKASLVFYESNIRWQPPESPFPDFDNFTTHQKALWLYLTRGTVSTVTPTELYPIIIEFLDKLCDYKDAPSNLKEPWRTALEKQFGIDEFTLSHIETYFSEFESRSGMKFQDQK